VSLPVDLDALRERIAEYGNTPFLVTVNEDGTAHVVSVTLRHEGDGLAVPLGRRSRANVERNREVTLLWPPRPDPAYSMIVDARVVSFGGDNAEITLEPHSAVLHRVSGAEGDGPTCIPVAEPMSRD
jgi:hypothetical protein